MSSKMEDAFIHAARSVANRMDGHDTELQNIRRRLTALESAAKPNRQEIPDSSAAPAKSARERIAEIVATWVGVVEPNLIADRILREVVMGLLAKAAQDARLGTTKLLSGGGTILFQESAEQIAARIIQRECGI
ncbi:MAG: hypothetical protein KGL39_53725 [Patescibacteria group bacterium]|nr:hypothetical protein [Patescibacteria group bacterium]